MTCHNIKCCLTTFYFFNNNNNNHNNNTMLVHTFIMHATYVLQALKTFHILILQQEQYIKIEFYKALYKK